MAKLISITLSFIFFCGIVFGRRTKLSSDNPKVQTAIHAADGVCNAIVLTYNYPCHEHTVTTQDGYILSLQNIPFGRSGNTSGDRPPVLLQHGLFMDAITWILNPPEQSLAFILADKGFDVWLVSLRGTKYSRAHTSLSPIDPKLWDWSWDELAAYDLPATVQYVHDQRGQKLHYVGHSQGTLMALAAFSKGQLVNMVRSAALLCPISYVGHVTVPLLKEGAIAYVPEELYNLRIFEINPRAAALMDILKGFCTLKGIECTNLLPAITGQNCCLNSSNMDVLLQYEPQSTSTKNLIHFAQMIRDGTVRMFDYGNALANKNRYGQETPPSYEMTNIPQDLPLFLAYGGADGLSVPDDVKLLLNNLNNHQRDKLVLEYKEEYGHMDHVIGVNAKEIVYDPLIAFFKQH